MPQNDYDITTGDANTGITYRAAVNAALQAQASNNSGPSAPGTNYPYQFYINDSASPAVMYIRKAGSSDWVRWAEVDAVTQALIVDTVVNADTVDGFHAGNAAGKVPVLDGSADLPLDQIPDTLTGKDADTVDGAHAGNGADEVLVLDSSGLVPVANLPCQGIRDISRGLVIKNTVANPAYQVDIDADEIMLQSSTPLALTVSSVNLTVDITDSGADGLDTGAEATSTWYYLWVIYNPSTTTTAGLLSISSTAPTMPAGYTYKALVGAVYNDSGDDFIVFHQLDNRVVIGVNTAFSGATDATYTSKSLAAFVPATAKLMKGFLNITAAASAASAFLASTSAGIGATIAEVRKIAATNDQTVTVEVLLVEPQTVYFMLSGGDDVDLDINGWEY